MSPVPAEAICRGCHGELYRSLHGWQHADQPGGMGRHLPDPMGDTERREHEEAVRKLMQDVPLITREEFLRQVEATHRGDSATSGGERA